MQFITDRRSALASIGAGLMVSGLAAAAPARADTPLAPTGATSLRDLSRQLAAAPRRRDFKTVPMILDAGSGRGLWGAGAARGDSPTLG
jgi:hypothetical protein